MTGFHEARGRAHAAGLAAARSTEHVDLATAHGRTLAAAVFAGAPLPGFASAAMDGWAVNGDGPWMLGAPISAGDDIPTQPLAPGAARPISTGAPLPPATARVIRWERGELRGPELTEVTPDARKHIRLAGEESPGGELLIDAGLLLTPPRIALAAAAGLDLLEVVAAPSVRLLVLGDEVVGHGAPIPGHLRDVFSPALPALLASWGTSVGGTQRVGDSLAETASAIAVNELPLLITTGGSSRGTADHVRASLTALDADVLLDGIRMRPGHPLLVARTHGTLVLCLPGNPLAAFAGLIAIGGALIAGMLGQSLRALDRVVLAEAVTGGPSTRILPAIRTAAGVVPTAHQGAGMLRGLASAELLAVIAPRGAAAGESVEYLPLPW